MSRLHQSGDPDKQVGNHIIAICVTEHFAAAAAIENHRRLRSGGARNGNAIRACKFAGVLERKANLKAGDKRVINRIQAVRLKDILQVRFAIEPLIDLQLMIQLNIGLARLGRKAGSALCATKVFTEDR